MLAVLSVEIKVGGMRFVARLETERAPKSCAKFRSMLPLNTKIIQARWSGESAWIPFGELNLDIGYENHTSHPAPGHLAGNHFATVYEGNERLPELGHLVLWKGAQEITFTEIA
jgi:hypothetical protein